MHRPTRLQRLTPFAFLALATAASLFALWPPAHLILAHANLATLFHENIGYHFFMALRLVDGAPGEFVHPGQGVLLALIQAFYYLIGRDLGLDLWGQLSLFGQLTLGIADAALLLLVLAIALDRKLDPALRAALVTVPLVVGPAHAHVFFYGLYPDYPAYAKPLFLLFAWRWLAWRGWRGLASWQAACELAAIGGLLGALKVNYVVFPAGLLLASCCVTAALRPGLALRLAATGAVVGAGVIGGLFLLYYGGSLEAIGRFFAVLWDFSRLLSETSGISIDPFASWSINSYSNLAWLAAVLAALCLSAFGTGRARAIFLALTLALLGAVAVAMAYWRGGGVSYFDAVVVISILSVLACASLGKQRPMRIAAFSLATLFLLWPAAWITVHWRIYSTDDELLPLLADAGDWQRGLYQWNLSHGLPIYVLMPSNNFPQGTIEDMMMRGLTNFGDLWYQANDSPTRAERFPLEHFVSYAAALPPQPIVFMWVTGDGPFLTVDEPMLAHQKAEVERLLAGRRREACYRVTQLFTGGIVVSCVVSAPAS